MESTIFKFIWKHSARQQFILLSMTVAAFPFVYLSLDLPKIIINRAINGPASDFPRVVSVLGSELVELQQIPYLLVLCFTFLALIFINGGFKYVINVYSGVIGERMLRRLRYQLLSRMMRFPLAHFRKLSQGEMVSMTVAETEPLGGFVGQAFRLPAFQGGTLLTILVFMFVQDWKLGLAAIALYPLQAWLIPKLQRRVNDLRKRQVVKKRGLSERIGEVVTGIPELHVHDTSRFELAEFSRRLGEIYAIRFEIYVRKFMIKFLNNFMAQITPFFFYSIGGYLVIQGTLSFGALVAVLAAYKDLSSPWKELLNFYQMKEDARIKYDLLAETFQSPGMMPEELQTAEPAEMPILKGELLASNVDLREQADASAASGATFRLDLRQRIAVTGSGGSGVQRLGSIIARLTPPLSGKLTLAGMDLAALPESVTGRRISYVGQDPRLRSGSVRDNLLYSLKHRPVIPVEYTGEAKRVRENELEEARRSGNSEHDVAADWVDYAAAGAVDADDLAAKAMRALELVDLADDVYGFGLTGVIDPAERPDLAESFLRARAELRERLRAPEMSDLVEPFDREKYNHNMSIAENLLFGTPRDASFDLANLGENPYVRKVLHEVGLMSEFLEMGRKLAELMVELFADVPPDSELFEQYSFISADDLPEFRNLLGRTGDRPLDGLDPADRSMLLALPFRLVSSRHRLGLIDESVQARLLHARRAFESGFDLGSPAVEFFDEDRYNAAGSIQDNILFGRLAYGKARSAGQIGALIRDVVEKLDLRHAVMNVGLDSQVGIGAARLSAAQRQKLAIARCILKRPDLFVVDSATASFDAATEEEIRRNLFEETREGGLIWVVQDANLAAKFDQVLRLEEGKVAYLGPPDGLDANLEN